MRAGWGLFAMAAGFLGGPALAEALPPLPAGLAGLLGWTAARALLPNLRKLESEDPPR